MPGALEDIRVIDFTHVLNGPFSTMLLGPVRHIMRLWTNNGHESYFVLNDSGCRSC